MTTQHSNAELVELVERAERVEEEGRNNKGLMLPRLRRTRNAFEMSQAELAEKVGVGKTSIIRWEKGEVGPRDLSVVRRIADVFGLDFVDLTEEKDLEDFASQLREPQHLQALSSDEPRSKEGHAEWREKYEILREDHEALQARVDKLGGIEALEKFVASEGPVLFRTLLKRNFG